MWSVAQDQKVYPAVKGHSLMYVLYVASVNFTKFWVCPCLTFLCPMEAGCAFPLLVILGGPFMCTVAEATTDGCTGEAEETGEGTEARHSYSPTVLELTTKVRLAEWLMATLGSDLKRAR